MKLEEEARACRISIDFSTATLPEVLKWMARSIRVHWLPLGDDEPEWIRKAHPRGVSEFDDESKTTVLRVA